MILFICGANELAFEYYPPRVLTSFSPLVGLFNFFGSKGLEIFYFNTEPMPFNGEGGAIELGF